MWRLSCRLNFCKIMSVKDNSALQQAREQNVCTAHAVGPDTESEEHNSFFPSLVAFQITTQKPKIMVIGSAMPGNIVNGNLNDIWPCDGYNLILSGDGENLFGWAKGRPELLSITDKKYKSSHPYVPGEIITAA